MNTQRRIFRGRSGPTDRNLPKYNARRRRQPKPSSQGDDTAIALVRGKPGQNDDNSVSSSSSSSMREDLVILQEDINPISSHPPTTIAADQHDNVSSNSNEPWREEIRHVQRRIRNVQESIQLGTEGIANPTTYRNNVLNAVENCINEWRAILNHYHNNSNSGISDDPTNLTKLSIMESSDNTAELQPEAVEASGIIMESSNKEVSQNNHSDAIEQTGGIDSDVVKETALQVYMLLQLALQCGPLTGSNPGYFKRCGGNVAKIVEEFLNKVVPNEMECTQVLHFTEKQAKAISGWRINAHKAAQQDKPPSKSALKKQEGKSKKKKKHKK